MRNTLLFAILIAAMAFSGTALADGPASAAADEDAERELELDPLPTTGEAIAGTRVRRGRRVTRRRGRRVVRRRVTRRRAVRRYYRPRTRRTVIVTRRHRHRRRVYRETHIVRRTQRRDVVSGRQRSRSGLAAGIRFSALSVGDTALRSESFTGTTVAGIGGYIRGRFSDHLGVEFSIDILGSDEFAYQQLSFPVLGALTVHLFPDSLFDIYGLAGAGMIFDNITYYGDSGLIYEESFSQFAGQLGAGFEANLGAIQLTGDVRYLAMQARPERDPALRSDVPLNAPIKDDGSLAPFSQEPDSVNHGLMFMIGLGGTF